VWHQRTPHTWCTYTWVCWRWLQPWTISSQHVRTIRCKCWQINVRWYHPKCTEKCIHIIWLQWKCTKRYIEYAEDISDILHALQHHLFSDECNATAVDSPAMLLWWLHKLNDLLPTSVHRCTAKWQVNADKTERFTWVCPSDIHFSWYLLPTIQKNAFTESRVKVYEKVYSLSMLKTYLHCMHVNIICLPTTCNATAMDIPVTFIW